MPVPPPALPRSLDLASPAPVIACMSGTHSARDVALAAADYARSCNRPLILFHAINAPDDPFELPDPLEWSIRRHEARHELGELRETLGDVLQNISVELEDGDLLAALTGRSGGNSVVLVIGAPSPHEREGADGHFARLAVEKHPGSVLLVPPGYTHKAEGMTRIAVPLDGSNYAEAALAEATRLAMASHAELILIHVVPDANLTDFGPPATSDVELRLRLDRRNEEAACTFLETTRRRLADQGLAVRSRCLKGDTRSALLRALGEEEADLVMLSARGQGGKRCDDLALGGTASYLVDHLTGPVMLMRSSASSQPATFCGRTPHAPRAA